MPKGRYTVYRVGFGVNRPPIKMGTRSSLEGARRFAKSYLRSLYPERRISRDDADIYTEITGPGKYSEYVLPGLGRGRKFRLAPGCEKSILVGPDTDMFMRRPKEGAKEELKMWKDVLGPDRRIPQDIQRWIDE